MADRGKKFALPAGSFPEMVCGVNGVNLTHSFLPTYFTAKWSKDGTALIEVAIWGPQVRSDGTLGKRMLDHCWRTPGSSGGVNLDDIHPAIAQVVRDYAAANRLAI